MSALFVPGLILLEASRSIFFDSSKASCSEVCDIGDLGPSWSSAMGGGLGRRGELEGDIVAAAMFALKVQNVRRVEV